MSAVFDHALRQQYAQILRYVRRRTRSVEDAEDVTQEVFASAAALLAKNPSRNPTLAWLYMVAQRRLADASRRSARRPRLARGGMSNEGSQTGDYGAEVARALSSAITHVPSGQREVVVMKLLEGRTFADIASHLGISEEACRSRFSRGLGRLREVLKQEGVEP